MVYIFCRYSRAVVRSKKQEGESSNPRPPEGEGFTFITAKILEAIAPPAPKVF